MTREGAMSLCQACSGLLLIFVGVDMQDKVTSALQIGTGVLLMCIGCGATRKGGERG